MPANEFHGVRGVHKRLELQELAGVYGHPMQGRAPHHTIGCARHKRAHTQSQRGPVALHACSIPVQILLHSVSHTARKLKHLLSDEVLRVAQRPNQALYPLDFEHHDLSDHNGACVPLQVVGKLWQIWTNRPTNEIQSGGITKAQSEI